MATVIYISDLAELLRGERVHFNLSSPSLVEYAVGRGEVRLTANGAVTGCTGEHTGRSPKDTFIGRDEMTRDTEDCGAVTQPVKPRVFDALHKRVIDYLRDR